MWQISRRSASALEYGIRGVPAESFAAHEGHPLGGGGTSYALLADVVEGVAEDSGFLSSPDPGEPDGDGQTTGLGPPSALVERPACLTATPLAPEPLQLGLEHLAPDPLELVSEHVDGIEGLLVGGQEPSKLGPLIVPQRSSRYPKPFGCPCCCCAKDQQKSRSSPPRRLFGQGAFPSAPIHTQPKRRVQS